MILDLLIAVVGVLAVAIPLTHSAVAPADVHQLTIFDILDN